MTRTLTATTVLAWPAIAEPGLDAEDDHSIDLTLPPTLADLERRCGHLPGECNGTCRPTTRELTHA